MTTQTPQTTQTQQPSSPHLTAALELLDELEAVTHGPDADSHTQAVTAAAQSILVLAEQVAAIRVLMVGDAMSRNGNGQAAPQADGPAAAQANGQPAPQGQKAPRKGGWW